MDMVFFFPLLFQCQVPWNHFGFAFFPFSAFFLGVFFLELDISRRALGDFEIFVGRRHGYTQMCSRQFLNIAQVEKPSSSIVH